MELLQDPSESLRHAGLNGLRRLHQLLPMRSAIGLLSALLATLLIAVLSTLSLKTSEETSERTAHTLQVREQLQSLLSDLKDAETAQRGFLLTQAETYLLPYTNAKAALPGRFQVLRGLLATDPRQLARLGIVEELAREKMEGLGLTIDLVRTGQPDAALAIVRSDRGKIAMDRIRAVSAEMIDDEQRLLESRQRDGRDAARTTVWITIGGAALLLMLIALAAVMASRDHRSRERESWLRAGRAGFSLLLVGEQRLQDLGFRALEYLAAYLDAQVGTVHLVDAAAIRLLATYGLHDAAADAAFAKTASAGSASAGSASADSASAEANTADFVAAQGQTGGRHHGLVMEAMRSQQVLQVRNVPAGYLQVSSSLGRADPRELLLAPARIDGNVQAVIELGFLRKVGEGDLELIERVCEMFAVAVRTGKDRARLEELLQQTQTQAEELQAQQEELRVSNEELEEQGNALRESQVQLESQQAELEQTNSQLEEQAQQLEDQRDDLTRSQAVLADKAAELERASVYKSEFLANMSHELRTPLNSSLILSKLLGDNRHGNLSAEQVKFARAIHGAGRDLLVLINDILDLSKIESGKVDLDIESVRVQETVDAIAKTFQPMTEDKGLRFDISVADGTPAELQTDGRRLGQILKNLLSNAAKFTDKGGAVGLRVAAGANETLTFTVTDSGIGVPPEQHEVIFEAFRQADGSTHRKYGGTGLGLSISRDLARLLGGDLTLKSEAGQGSEFTLTVPRILSRPAASPAVVKAGRSVGAVGPAVAVGASRSSLPVPKPARRALDARPARSVLPASELEDDRDRLTPGSRLILVIEDDLRFAAILRDLAHELGFQCIATDTADAGLAAAISHAPAAILLDMNLPDGSGLSVLDQLKRNPQTRHIPVHVASVSDYSQEALQLGAVGYALKPVQRENLVDAFRRLEAKMSQSVKRVLVVEDDALQRESIGLLLGSEEVQIISVESAADALEQLQATTFDCMVMDLNLPDLSGYELLEKMAQQESGLHGHGSSFPPVIVYTGRSLDAAEEQKLQRFSRSIIIKDARSPERLLDEVTLFIHQVEAKLPADRRQMLKLARDRDAALEGRRILVVEDDVRNIFALTGVLEPKGAQLVIARNGREALEALERHSAPGAGAIDLVLMDLMMPEMDGLTATRQIRKRREWQKLPIIALTARAMKGDQERCFEAGANDYITKPLDVEKLLSLVRVWMPKQC